MSQDRNKRVGAVFLVAVLLGGLAAWTWAGSISASQREERDDLDLFLDASSAGWAQVTSEFFMAHEVAAQTIGSLAEHMETTEEQLALLAETIRRRGSLDAAYIGYPDGSFFFVARSDEAAAGGFRTRVISFDGDERQVELTWTDGALDPLRSELDSEDTYDPRQRPWYVPIDGGADWFWTAPYVFASSQQPGITYSTPVVGDNGELVAVVGIDIRLTEVTEFLDEFSPGTNGIALVVDGGGQVVAESSMDVGDFETEAIDGSLALSQSPELRALVDQLSSQEPGTVRDRSSDGVRTTIVRPAGARGEWYLAVQALDEDFLNDETASNAFAAFAVGVTMTGFVGALGYAVLRYLVGLKQEAEIDELTGIYNRRAIKRELQALLGRSKQPLHVAIIDLDNFKSINDEYGHPVGDQVLASMANRLEHFSRINDTIIGRLGGDEFVVFGEGKSPDWSWLNELLAESTTVNGLDLKVTASIGVARCAPTESPDIEELFGAADRLLFDAKRQGGDGFRFADTGGE